VRISPFSLLVLCGITVMGFVVGRFTVSVEKGDARGEHVANKSSVSTGYADGTDFAASRSRGVGGSQNFSPIKSAEELRGEFKKLNARRFDGFGYTKEMVQLQDRLDRLGVSDIAALIQEYAQGTFSPSDTQGLDMLFRSMSEKDPEAAWNLAATLPPSMKKLALQAAIVGLAEKFPDAVMIFIRPKDREVLKERLARRGTESPEAAGLRLYRAIEELDLADRYTYQVVNDDLATAAHELHNILKSLISCKSSREQI